MFSTSIFLLKWFSQMNSPLDVHSKEKHSKKKVALRMISLCNLAPLPQRFGKLPREKLFLKCFIYENHIVKKVTLEMFSPCNLALLPQCSCLRGKKMVKFRMEGKMVTSLSRKKEMGLHFPQEVWLSRQVERP